MNGMVQNSRSILLVITFLFVNSIQDSFGFQFRSMASNIVGVKCIKTISRRSFSHNFVLTGLLSGGSLIQKEQAKASWFEGKERRQLEFCVVNVLRVLYWAEIESRNLEQAVNDGNDNMRKELYVESRLSAKALVTGKIGGGSTNRVYTLASLKLRDCLDDLVFYSTSSRVLSGLSEDLIESLASLVEFDGLETTIDPSPRSTLMLKMYNKDKETFVRRMLKDRIILTAKQIVGSVDPDVQSRCEAYVQATYPNEVPKKAIVAAASTPSFA